MNKVKLVVVGFFVSSLWGQQQIKLVAPPPSPVTSVSVSRVGNPGNTSYYYWIVANYPIGKSIASPFALQNQSPDTLSVSNYNVVSYVPVSGAINYDILRTTSPNLVMPCTCAIATGQTSGSYNDQSNSASSYNLNPVGTFTASITLDNQTHAQARINIDTPLDIPYLGSYIVASLPSAPKGYALAVVTDGANSTTPCTSGGGSTFSACIWNGTAWQAMGSGGAGSTPPTLVSFNTATSTCTVVSGTASGCTASSTSGTGSKPGIVVTDNFGQVVKWGSCFSGGTPSGIFGGLTYGNAIQDVTITSSNNVTTFTFSVDSSGYCGISTGGMGPIGATGQGVPTGGTTGQTLIKNSNTNYDTTWANAPSGPGQVAINNGMNLRANGAGSTSWQAEQWMGSALGAPRFLRTWLAERVNNSTNTFVPYSADMICNAGTCGFGQLWGNGSYLTALPITTGAGVGGFYSPYGTFIPGWTGSGNERMAIRARYYNAGGPTATINIWALAIDGTANNLFGGVSSESSSYVGFRYHTNTDFTDPSWMCVYAQTVRTVPSGYTEVASGVALDTNWHTFEIAAIDSGVGSPDLQFYIDGTRVCQAGISSATYTPAAFFTNLVTTTPGIYYGSSLYNYAALTGNEWDVRWMQVSTVIQ